MQLLILVVCAIALFLTWLLYREIQRQNRPYISTTLVAHKPVAKSAAHGGDRKSSVRTSSGGKSSFRFELAPRKTSQRPSKKAQSSKPTGNTYPKLVKLLNGDRSAAQRLVQSLMLKHPDRSEEWCYEKAVFDLERDRG